MKKTLVKLVAVLLSLVIIMGISGAAFADAEHDDCGGCHSESHKDEPTRAIMCDACGRNGMFKTLFSIGDWAFVPGMGRDCNHSYGGREYQVRRAYEYHYICSYCGYIEPAFYEYEYAWYCISEHEYFPA